MVKVDDRVYYDHRDGDNTDTGTVIEIREIPEEGRGIIRQAETLAMVLWDSGQMDETSVNNLRKL